MNNHNLVRSLAEEAMTWAYQVCKEYGRPGGHNDHIWVSLVMGKYSELLINKCITVLEENEDATWQSNYRWGWNAAKELLQSQFSTEKT